MNVLGSDAKITGKMFKYLIYKKSFTGAEGNPIKEKYKKSCMVHINSPYVVTITLILPNLGVLDTARRFSLILIHTVPGIRL